MGQSKRVTPLTLRRPLMHDGPGVRLFITSEEIYVVKRKASVDLHELLGCSMFSLLFILMNEKKRI